MTYEELNALVDAHIQEHLPYWIQQLERLCNQPSISAQNVGMAECAELVATLLKEHGFAAEVMPYKGYPLVYGEANGRAPKTLLMYLHYDVQPPEPLELWESPPFELTQREDKLYARGVTDDKGHIIARLAALVALREVLGELPCHIKFLIEGEEEIASPTMPQFVEDYQDKLAADACIWEFGSLNPEGRLNQSLGMRGIVYFELSAHTAEEDAHSGLGGSILPNAAWRLVWALNSLKDHDERILIPGFYDNVVPPTPRDLELLAQLPDNAADLQKRFGVAHFLKGMTGGVELRRTAVMEPTCTICGLNAGYQGAGLKTVIPAHASAKVDFRLVPNQTPAEIEAKLRAHLDAQGFSDIHIHAYGGGRPAKVDPDDPFVRLTNETALEVYGIEPIIEPMIGGSGPSYPFIHILKVPVVLAGVGYPGGRAHAPNENIRIPDFINGIRHTARIVARFASA